MVLDQPDAQGELTLYQILWYPLMSTRLSEQFTLPLQLTPMSPRALPPYSPLYHSSALPTLQHLMLA